MNAKFELGRITVKEDAMLVLARAGQDAAFFIEKHASGDWSEEDRAANEQGLREGGTVFSFYRTLLGHHIFIFTFFESAKTVVSSPPAAATDHRSE